MKVIIFNDKQNFDGNLTLINKKFPKGEKRFWDIKKYIPFLFEKLKSIKKLKNLDLELTKTLLYTGKYNSRLISKVKWSCSKNIKDTNKIIKTEKDLLDELSKHNIDKDLKKKVNQHVNNIKRIFENRKKYYINKIEKQKRNFKGQKSLFSKIENMSLIELRTTPLKQSDGEVYQKGIDVKLAIDLVNLAHNGAYDIALILGGDTDLIEAVKLVKNSLGKTVIIIANYVPGDPLSSNISDLKNEADHFLNLNSDFKKEELIQMSDPLKQK